MDKYLKKYQTSGDQCTTYLVGLQLLETAIQKACSCEQTVLLRCTSDLFKTYLPKRLSKCDTLQFKSTAEVKHTHKINQYRDVHLQKGKLYKTRKVAKSELNQSKNKTSVDSMELPSRHFIRGTK